MEVTATRSGHPVPLRYILGSHRFQMVFAPGEVARVQVRYRQRAPDQDARYILRTTQPWGRPLIASALATTATAFVGYWPMESFTIQAVERFAADQLAYAEQQRKEHGKPRFNDLTNRDDWGPSLGLLRGGTYEFELGEDGESFTLLVLPQEDFPHYPFNLLTSQPSLRVDETGAIRMIRVSEPDTYCPADAPMVLRVVTAAPSGPGR